MAQSSPELFVIYDRIVKDVEDWFKATGEPMKLRILSQRYARTLAEHGDGMRVQDVTGNHNKLQMRMNVDGGYLVVPEDLLIKRVEAGLNLEEYWAPFLNPPKKKRERRKKSEMPVSY